MNILVRSFDQKLAHREVLAGFEKAWTHSVVNHWNLLDLQ